MSDNDDKPYCYTCHNTRQISKLFERACNICNGTGRIGTTNDYQTHYSSCGCDNGKVQSWGPARCDNC